MKGILSLVVLALLTMNVAGCKALMYKPFAPHPNVSEPTVDFDASDLSARVVEGHAIIRGQAFSKTRAGDVKYGAGNLISMWPKTDYTEQCLRIMAVGNSTCGEKLRPYTRQVQADGEGRFEIDDVKPGDYLLFTVITWSVPGPFGLESTGGAVAGEAHVKDDTQIVTVYLN